jgi:hypothetical protein
LFVTLTSGVQVETASVAEAVLFLRPEDLGIRKFQTGDIDKTAV